MVLRIAASPWARTTTSSVSGPAVAVPGRLSPTHRRTPRPSRARTPGRPLRHDGGGLRGAGRGGGRRGVSDRRGAARGCVAALAGGGGSAPALPGGGSHVSGPAVPAAWELMDQGAAGTCPGLPWSVLAAIGRVESDSGRSRAPGVASGANAAGAEGPMQFEPATFARLRGGRPRRVPRPLPLRPGRRGLQRRQAALRRRRRGPGVAHDRDRRLQPLVGLRRDRGGARPGARLEPGNGRRRRKRAPVRGRAARHPLSLGRDR